MCPFLLALSSDCGDEARPRRRKREAQGGKRISAAAGAVTKPVTLRDGWTDTRFPRTEAVPRARSSGGSFQHPLLHLLLLQRPRRRQSCPPVRSPSWLEITIRQRARRGQSRTKRQTGAKLSIPQRSLSKCAALRPRARAREVTRSNRGNLSIKT